MNMLCLKCYLNVMYATNNVYLFFYLWCMQWKYLVVHNWILTDNDDWRGGTPSFRSVERQEAKLPSKAAAQQTKALLFTRNQVFGRVLLSQETAKLMLLIALRDPGVTFSTMIRSPTWMSELFTWVFPKKGKEEEAGWMTAASHQSRLRYAMNF